MLLQHPKKPLILIDGSSYLFRAYHALPPLTNSKGKPTGAIYGVLNMIKKIMGDYQPEHIAVIFDSKAKTFRHELYAEYKANRIQMPDELAEQIQPLHEAIRALGLPLIIEEGVEADDVIATLAYVAQKNDMPVLISTGDKDMAQIVNDNITLINTMTNRMLDPEGVKEKFGVMPEQIVDYLALMGDSVDNIPGVPKVGPKTATKWLNEYGTLDNLIKHADAIKGKVGENLRNHLDELPLARDLVTVKSDVALKESITELVPTEKNKQKLCALFAELEFKRWLVELESEQNTGTEQPIQYDIVLNKKTFNYWLSKLKQSDYFAFDTETTALDAMRAELVGISFAVMPGEAAYVPLTHDYPDAPEQLERQWVLDQLQPLFADPNKILIGQNLKYDLKILAHYNVAIEARLFDTMLESYVVNNGSMRHDMDTLAMKFLAKRTIKFEDIAGKGARQLTFNQIDLQQAGPYAAEDADVTLQLHETLLGKIKDDENSQRVLNDIELPLMPILARMEYTGVLIDASMLAKQSVSLQKKIAELKNEAYQLAGASFNLSSTKQLQEILFKQQGLPILKKTPKGAPSTAEDVMKELALDYPLPKIILEYRSLAKLKSTYTDSLPQQINPKTGRVHTSYNQAITVTGRLSSTEPNLQNIPARSEEGRKIRQAFVAQQGYKIIAADYSQVELRIMAHLSQDPNLLSAFAKDLDVHRATAAEVYGIAIDKVTDLQRRSAKAINFGLMYGMSGFGLAKQLGIGRKEAEQYIEVYFARYPKVHQYMERARTLAAEQGYVETLYGRKLLMPEIHASNLQRRRAAERAAINAPLQGSAADIIKLAMICVDDWIQQSQCDVKMIMQVHDELVFEIKESDMDEATTHIRACMEHAMDLSVPLVVDIGVGNNWNEAH